MLPQSDLPYIKVFK